jgi:hypothetical protein
MVVPSGTGLVMPSSIRPSPDAVTTRVGDEVVLVHLKTERMHVLNSTGARLWDLLCAGRDWSDIRGVMMREFDVTPDQLDGETEDLLRSLKEEQLISSDREDAE